MKPNYVKFLEEEILSRKVRNAGYSERAFARCIGISPGFLKLILQGKKNLSAERAAEIATRLSWHELKRKTFLALVLSADKTLPKKERSIPIDDFIEISDWYHFAILELIRVEPKALEMGAFARRLGISTKEAAFAFKLLERKGLLKRTKQGYRSPKNYEVPAISAPAIRKHHRQMLEKAVAALDTQPVNQREIQGVTLALDRSRLPEAKAAIEKFIDGFNRRFGSGTPPDSVYQLSLALFQLDRSRE